MNFEDRIVNAMDKAGIHIMGEIDWCSREFQRFQVQNHWSRRKPLFLILFGLGASFGDWRDPGTWKTIWEKSFAEMSRQEKLERDAHFQKMAREKEIRRCDAIYRAHLMLTHRSHHGDTCKEASVTHPYVLAKRITPHSGYQIRSYIVLPVTDVNGHLISLQYIKPNGFKQFKKHTSPKEGMLFIGDIINNSTTIRVCEGWATGCSIYDAMGEMVVVAFAAGNLANVAVALRIKYPLNPIVICADNDHTNTENTGMLHGIDAAKKTGSRIVFPSFEKFDAVSKYSDFNDLFCISNLEEVKKQLLEFKKK